MFTKYLVTGATGFLGRSVIAALSGAGAEIRALVLENDPLAYALPPAVQIIHGDVCDADSQEGFFSGADRETCVIHCAGLVSVASHPGARIYRVNVGGTDNVLRHCARHGVGRLIYVSSVHAIPEQPEGEVITEDAVFSPELVRGDYAKSKALATALVFDAAARGLNASVVFPSGIIGPGDLGRGSVTTMLSDFLSGKLPLAVQGGYDFVDVRDVAAGVVACAERGEPGRGYILSGHDASIRDILEAANKTLPVRRRITCLPIGLAKLAAPFYEKRNLRRKLPLYFTPYAVAVLASNCLFSKKAAEEAWGYAPRPLERSVRDTVSWLKNANGTAERSRDKAKS
jgi:dihydroflavonol-4-reductase